MNKTLICPFLMPLLMLASCGSGSGNSGSGVVDSSIDGLTFGSCERTSSDFEAGSLIHPTSITTGVVLGGLVDGRNDTIGNSDYWKLSMPSGNYVVIAEALKVFPFDNETRYLIVSQLGDVVTPLIEIDKLDTFIRQIEIVEIDTDTDVFEVASSAVESESYDLIFYRLDDTIPTPLIVNCFYKTVASVGTTESFGISDYEENHYYLVDNLPAGVYHLTVSTSVIAEGQEMSGITVSVNNDSGDHRSERTILVHESVDSFSSNNVEFTHAETGDLLLRFSRALTEQMIEFTIETK